jgi:choline-phosphate cytidylyltransferase
MELKEHYVKKYGADVLIMGDDWSGKFDGLCKEVVYLQRTPEISTTFYINKILNE